MEEFDGGSEISGQTLDSLVSSSLPPKQYGVLVPSHKVGLNSNQTLTDYSHKICATVALEYLIERASLLIKGLVAVSFAFLVDSLQRNSRSRGEGCVFNFSMFNELRRCLCL